MQRVQFGPYLFETMFPLDLGVPHYFGFVTPTSFLPHRPAMVPEVQEWQSSGKLPKGRTGSSVQRNWQT